MRGDRAATGLALTSAPSPLPCPYGRSDPRCTDPRGNSSSPRGRAASAAATEDRHYSIQRGLDLLIRRAGDVGERTSPRKDHKLAPATKGFGDRVHVARSLRAIGPPSGATPCYEGADERPASTSRLVTTRPAAAAARAVPHATYSVVAGEDVRSVRGGASRRIRETQATIQRNFMIARSAFESPFDRDACHATLRRPRRQGRATTAAFNSDRPRELPPRWPTQRLPGLTRWAGVLPHRRRAGDERSFAVRSELPLDFW